jgi:hypothetical protein
MDLSRISYEFTPTVYSRMLRKPTQVGTQDFEGRFYTDPYLPIGYGPPISPDMLAWGAKGWNRALPVHPTNNIGQFLVELKDVPEMLRSTRELLSVFKGDWAKGKPISFWADQFLNGEFGWLPTISDLRGIFDLGARLQKAHTYLLANNGKPVRRRVHLKNEDITDRTITSGYRLLPTPPSAPFISGSGETVTWKRFATRIWFEGQFTFYIPPTQLDPFNPNKWLDAKLLGVYPDLNLLYKETPWTWLIDWFTSAGSVVSNITLMSEFNQVARYAYVMSKQTNEYGRAVLVRAHDGFYGPGGSKFQYTDLPTQLLIASAIVRFERKQRVRASPYGFGLAWESFSPFQISILSALGLSRSKF